MAHRVSTGSSLGEPLNVDELDALGNIDGLKDALARLRKFGGRCVLGFQSIAQVSSTYGAGEAHTIVENCGTTLILRCSGSEGGGTSRFASALIGDREVVRAEISRGSSHSSVFSRGGSSVSQSVTQRHITESAVMTSQIEQLPNLAGFLKLASHPAWIQVALMARPWFHGRVTSSYPASSGKFPAFALISGISGKKVWREGVSAASDADIRSTTRLRSMPSVTKSEELSAAAESFWSCR